MMDRNEIRIVCQQKEQLADWRKQLAEEAAEIARLRELLGKALCKGCVTQSWLEEAQQLPANDKSPFMVSDGTTNRRE